MKVGDRVRIDCPGSMYHGKGATIWEITRHGAWAKADIDNGTDPNCTAYRVDVDGIGRKNPSGLFAAFERYELRPIQPLGSWEELSQIIGKDIRKPVEVTA